jgi:putative oxidoreductase
LIEGDEGALLVPGYKVRPVAAAMAVFSITTAIFFRSNLADHVLGSASAPARSAPRL